MIDWDKLNYIEYLDYQFTQDNIKSGSLLLNRDLTCASLAIDTLSPVVECYDKTILDFERDTPLYYYRAGRLRGVYYVQSIDRVGPIRYKITAQSAIALLDRGRHMGGIYTGQEAGEVLPDITGGVPIHVKTNVAKQKLYGWLPIASPRSNLAQALFALGAAIRTGMDGALHVAFLWDGLSGVIPPDDTYREGGSVRAQGRVTQVAVTEHQYIEGGEIKTLFEGTAQQGDPVTFDAPMYDLQATGFAILDSGANYAVLSAGSGTLTGREYVHNTRLVTRSLWLAPDPKVQSFPDTTMVSLVNSSAVADRLANYYKHHQTVEESVIYTGQSCGDLLQIPDPFDAVQTEGCLESAEISLSSVLKAKLMMTKEFVPLKSEEVAYYDDVVLLTGSGSWTPPEGVSSFTVVLISGGQGGWSGEAGEPGKQGGTDTFTYWVEGADGVTKYHAKQYSIGFGWGGDGGKAGIGGAGGRILQESLSLTNRDPILYNCGKGGAGGYPSTSGSNPGALGTDTTFGALTTAESGTNSAGFLDPISGLIYGCQGEAGVNGGKGTSCSKEESEYGTTEIQYSITGPNGVTYTSGARSNTGNSNRIKLQATNSSSQDANPQAFAGSGNSLGGGAAYGQDGPVNVIAGAISVTTTRCYAYAPPGANGASPALPAIPQTTLGAGGNGGHGGGGAGGEGVAYAGFEQALYVNPQPNLSAYHASSQSVGGLGCKGSDGADGCILIFFKRPNPIESGPVMDRSGRFLLDRFGRRIIV